MRELINLRMTNTADFKSVFDWLRENDNSRCQIVIPFHLLDRSDPPVDALLYSPTSILRREDEFIARHKREMVSFDERDFDALNIVIRTTDPELASLIYLTFAEYFL